MRVTVRSVLLAIAVLGGAQASRAELMLSLSSDAADVNAIQVGDTVTFRVELGGLGEAGNPSDLDFLSVDVSFPSILLGSASGLTAGAIVPDATGFGGSVGSGSASAFYDNLAVASPPGALITQNGVFFTFTVVAQAPGSGQLTFDPSPLGISTSFGDDVVFTTTPLSFTIVPSAIPEPSSVALAGLGLLGSLGIAASRRGR